MRPNFKKLQLSALNRKSLKEFKQTPKMGIMLLLDNIRSAHNVGSIFRSSDAFAVEHIYLTGITPSPEANFEIQKTALGAEKSVNWSQVDSEEALAMFRQNGYKIYAIEQAENSQNLVDFQWKMSDKYVFVLGNEVTGVSEFWMENCDGCLEIEQFGTKHSLNVSVTAGVLLYSICQGIKSVNTPR